MISFLSDVDSFFLWYIIGLSLLLSGLLFFAKISVQIRNINHRKRREIALFFIGGTGLVLFIRLILGWRILAGISSVGTIIIYLFYAKTYVVELDKFIKSNFTFLGFLD